MRASRRRGRPANRVHPPVVGRLHPPLRNGLPMRIQGRRRRQTRPRSNTRRAVPPVRRPMSPPRAARQSRSPIGRATCMYRPTPAVAGLAEPVASHLRAASSSSEYSATSPAMIPASRHQRTHSDTARSSMSASFKVYTGRQAGSIGHPRYFFASGFQFWMSVIGATASSSTMLMRNRPSDEPAY
jgi:hypothetical protein